MGKIQEDAALLAMFRALAYRWFQVALGFAPEGPALDWILSRCNLNGFRALGSEGTAFSAAFKVVEADCAALRARVGGERDLLYDAYMRLFVGPDALPVKPWESSWRGAEESLFQECTLEVRRVYFAEGYVCAGYPHVADDHVAIELDFLATLGMRLVEAIEGSDDAEARRLIGSSQSFLLSHAGAWVPRYAQACLELDSASYGFYTDVVQLLKAFLQLDEAALIELDGVLEAQQGERAYEQGDRFSEG